MKVRRVDMHADEFLAAVVGEMSPAELGVYWMICLLCYSRGGDIADNIDWLRAKFRPGKGNQIVGAILEHLIASGRVVRDGGQIGVSRCRDEIEMAQRRISEASESGRRGGRPRKENNELEKPSPFYDGKLTTNYQLPTTNNKPLRGSSRAVARDTAEQMLSVWREECGDALGSPTKASDSRITQCSARLRNELDGDLENWRAACRRIRRSAFLTEKWKATIDWALQPKNLLKVLEGNYDDRAETKVVEVSNRSPPKPINPKILGHGSECMCSNCERWAIQLSEAAE